MTLCRVGHDSLFVYCLFRYFRTTAVIYERINFGFARMLKLQFAICAEEGSQEYK